MTTSLCLCHSSCIFRKCPLKQVQVRTFWAWVFTAYKGECQNSDWKYIHVEDSYMIPWAGDFISGHPVTVDSILKKSTIFFQVLKNVDTQRSALSKPNLIYFITLYRTLLYCIFIMWPFMICLFIVLYILVHAVQWGLEVHPSWLQWEIVAII